MVCVWTYIGIYKVDFGTRRGEHSAEAGNDTVEWEVEEHSLLLASKIFAFVSTERFFVGVTILFCLCLLFLVLWGVRMLGSFFIPRRNGGDKTAKQPQFVIQEYRGGICHVMAREKDIEEQGKKKVVERRTRSRF